MDKPNQRYSTHKMKKESTEVQLESTPSSLSDLHRSVVLSYFAPPSVLVNHKGKILDAQGQVGNYLKAGAEAFNIVDGVHKELKPALSHAIKNAIKEQQEITVPNLSIQHNDQKEYINLIVTPIKEQTEHTDLLTIVFQQTELAENYEPNKATTSSHQEADPELLNAQQQLWKVIEALELTNEEGWSANKVMEYINKDLEALREELFAANKYFEDQTTELDRASSNSKNLMDGVDIISIFLDKQLYITHYTPLAKEIIALKESDIGSSIFSFKTKLKNDTLAEEAKQVLKSNKCIKKEVKTNDGIYYWLNLHPYQNTQDEAAGVAITFIDITKKKERELKLESYRNILEQLVLVKTKALSAKENQFLNIVNNIPGTVIRYRVDAEGEDSATFISEHSEKVWGVKSEDALRDFNLYWELVFPEDFPGMKSSIMRSADALTLWEQQWRIRTKSKQVKWLHGIGVPSRQDDGSTVWDTLILDITDKKLSELALQNKTALLERTEEIAMVGSWEWDVEQDKTYWSKEFYKIFGLNPKQGAPSLAEHAELISPISYKRLQVCVQQAVKYGNPYDVEIDVHRKDGSIRYCYGRGFARKDRQGNVTHLYGSFQDITERKITELRLLESRENYKNIADNIPGLVFRYKLMPNGTDELLFVSKGIEDIYEFSQTEALKDVSLMWKTIHPADLERFTNSVQESLEKLSFWNIEFRLLMPDGRIKWLNGRGTPKKIADGSVIWDTMSLDITQQKEAEEQRKTLKEQLDLAITTSQIGIWTLDTATKEIECNDQLLKLFGINQEKLKNQLQDWQDLIHPDDREYTNRETEKAFRGEPLTGIQFRIIRPNDDIRYINAAVSPVIENEKVVSLVGVNLDITDFKRAEAQLTQAKITAETNEERIRLKNEELKHAQRKLRSITEQLDLAINTARIGVWAQDLSNQHSEWNRELLKIYGISNEKLKATPSLIKTQIHPDDQKYAAQELKKTYAGQAVSDIRFRVVRPNGEIRYIDAAASPVIENDSVTSVIGINLDITEYKRIESELTRAKEQAEANERRVVQKNEELKKANEELDRFVYSVSHDLRAPIASSMGLCALSLASENLEEVHEYDQLSLKTLHKLDDFIQDILNYSRNSRVPIQLEPINFAELVDLALVQYHTEIEEGSVVVEKNVQTDGSFLGDHLRINIILNNLLSNAFKFRKNSEKLVMSIDVKSNHQSAILKVSDNGIGIKRAHQPQIFDMFYRGSAQRDGSGIGLYILKECVDKMEGSIQLESEERKGTTFEIRIPSVAV